MRTRLEAAQQQSKWTLDPAAYEAIRQCVQKADAQRKLDEEIRKLIPTAMPTGFPTALPTGFPTALPTAGDITITSPGDLGSLAVCEEAAKYLK